MEGERYQKIMTMLLLLLMMMMIGIHQKATQLVETSAELVVPVFHLILRIANCELRIANFERRKENTSLRIHKRTQIEKHGQVIVGRTLAS